MLALEQKQLNVARWWFQVSLKTFLKFLNSDPAAQRDSKQMLQYSPVF